jgi:hypothetical protein
MITMRSHDDLETSLMFVPGHMAFFRHTPTVLDSLLTYPVFASFAAFKAGPWFGEIADEAEWSHFLLTSPRLTWLVLPGLVDARVRFHHGPSRGVFELRDEWFWDGHSAHTLLPSTPDTRTALLAALRVVAPDTRPPPTFSDTGSEYAVALEPGAGAYVGGIWFDPAYALHANMDAARYRADLGFGQRYAFTVSATAPAGSTDRARAQVLLAAYTCRARARPAGARAQDRAAPAHAAQPEHTAVPARGLLLALPGREVCRCVRPRARARGC